MAIATPGRRFAKRVIRARSAIPDTRSRKDSGMSLARTAASTLFSPANSRRKPASTAARLTKRTSVTSGVVFRNVSTSRRCFAVAYRL